MCNFSAQNSSLGILSLSSIPVTSQLRVHLSAMRKPFPHKAEYRSDLIGLPLSEYQPTPVALCIEIGTYSSKVSVEQFIVTHIVWISRAWTFTLAIGKPRTNIVYFEKTAYPLFCSVTVYSICCSVIDVLDAKHWLKLPASQEASIRSIWFGH